MPELPEVETVRRGLQQFTCNIPIEEVQVLLPRTIDHPDSALDFANSLQGLVITDWQRRGKYLLGVCADQQGQLKGWLGVHLRMTGQLLWLTTPTEQTKHTRVRSKPRTPLRRPADIRQNVVDYGERRTQSSHGRLGQTRARTFLGRI
jgi:formamidopyrimidine-DNA glycosylase